MSFIDAKSSKKESSETSPSNDTCTSAKSSKKACSHSHLSDEEEVIADLKNRKGGKSFKANGKDMSIKSISGKAGKFTGNANAIGKAIKSNSICSR